MLALMPQSMATMRMRLPAMLSRGSACETKSFGSLHDTCYSIVSYGRYSGALRDASTGARAGARLRERGCGSAAAATRRGAAEAWRRRGGAAQARRRRGACEGAARHLRDQVDIVGVDLHDLLLVIPGEDDLAEHGAVVADALGQRARVDAVEGRDLVGGEPVRERLLEVPVAALRRVLGDDERRDVHLLLHRA